MLRAVQVRTRGLTTSALSRCEYWTSRSGHLYFTRQCHRYPL